MKQGMVDKRDKKTAVSICPGPNIAYFTKLLFMEDIVDHIYGKVNLIQNNNRPHMFINELNLYMEYFTNDIIQSIDDLTKKKEKYLTNFKNQLLEGIEYYKELVPKMTRESLNQRTIILNQFKEIEAQLKQLNVPTLA